MELTAIKKQLKNELDEAEKRLEKLETQLDDKPDVSLGTGSTGMATWEMALARKDRILQEIEEIQEAMARVKEGSYGRCSNCGAKIDEERLEILPTTTLCASCAGLSN